MASLAVSTAHTVTTETNTTSQRWGDFVGKWCTVVRANSDASSNAPGAARPDDASRALSATATGRSTHAPGTAAAASVRNSKRCTTR